MVRPNVIERVYESLRHNIHMHVQSAIRPDPGHVHVVCQVGQDTIVTRCDGGAVGAQEAVLFHSLEDADKIKDAYDIAGARSREFICDLLAEGDNPDHDEEYDK